MKPLQTPVLFIIFNRPDVTQKAFDAIRAAKPEKLFIAADGPRTNHPTDAKNCAETRSIATKIDWPCEAKTLFRDTNLGCGYAVSGALDWFFENVEEGIILEDDCVADLTFFPFCTELLARYRDNEKIMHISGDNFQYGRKRGSASYYFSEYPHIWGWATWRRSWKHNDFFCVPEPERRANWDAQWWQAVTKNKGLCILPNMNLVSNIGFGTDATHTRDIERFAALPTETMPFPLIHPRVIMRHVLADMYTYRTYFKGTWRDLAAKKFHRFVPKFIKDLLRKQ